MTGSQHSLPWISFSRLVELASHRFAKAAVRASQPTPEALATEPTLAIVRSSLDGSYIADAAEIDEAVALTKTIQNAVGLFHQDVLSSAPGWRTLGANGGLLDIKSTEPRTLADDRSVLAEVKMRYNTIKASDENKTYDKLKDALALHGSSDHVAYIFQIVPKNREAYDRPWKVSGRPEHPLIRAADGVTAYHLVTGDADALFNLIRVMPRVMAAVREQKTGTRDHDPIKAAQDQEAVESLLADSLPIRSAFLT